MAIPMLALMKISWVADPDRVGKAADDSSSELRGILRVVQPRHDDGELVATEAGDFRSQRGHGRPDLVLALAAAGTQP